MKKEDGNLLLTISFSYPSAGMRSCIPLSLLQGSAGETLERTTHYVRFLAMPHLQGRYTASALGGYTGAH